MMRLSQLILDDSSIECRRALPEESIIFLKDTPRQFFGVKNGVLIAQINELWEMKVFLQVLYHFRTRSLKRSLQYVTDRMSEEKEKIFIVRPEKGSMEFLKEEFVFDIGVLLSYLVLTIDDTDQKIFPDVGLAIWALKREMETPLVELFQEFPDSLLGYLRRVIRWAEATHKQTRNLLTNESVR
jgi:hypothetical protein